MIILQLLITVVVIVAANVIGLGRVKKPAQTPTHKGHDSKPMPPINSEPERLSAEEFNKLRETKGNDVTKW